MVREYQHYTYHDQYSVVDLSGSPKVECIAAAYDMDYLHLQNMEQCDQVIAELLKDDRSVLLECDIDPMDLVK